MTHAISWFEIPATDFDRAVEFYSTVLDYEIDEVEAEERYGVIQTDEEEVGGAINQAREFTPEGSDSTISYTPSDKEGIVVFLTVEGDIKETLSKVEPAGGEVIVGKTQTESGYYGFIKDSEGNQVGLLSRE